MTSRPFLGLFLLLAALPSSAAGTASIAWEAGLETALERAAAARKDVVVEFYADWCAECRALEKTTFADSALVAWSADLVWVRVNGDRDTVARDRYQVQAYPTVLVLGPTGAELDRILGLVPPGEFIRQTEDYRAGRNTLDALLRDEAGHEDDFDHQMRLADKLNGRGRIEEALPRYRRIFASAPDTLTALRAGFWIGRIHQRARRPAEALAAFEAAMARFTGRAERAFIAHAMAEVHASQGRRAEAARVLERFLAESPQSADREFLEQEIAKLRKKPQG